MVDNVIKVSVRDKVGSSATKKLREQGKIPAVLYSGSFGSKSIAIDENEIQKYVKAHGSGAKLVLDVDGVEEMAIVKQLQRDVVKGHITHVEFQHLSAGQKIKIALPVHYTGEDQIDKKYVVQKMVHELEIEALPKNLIDYIEIAVGHLQLGDALTIGNLDKSQFEGIEFIDDDEVMLATVIEPAIFVEPTDEDEDTVEGAAEGEDATAGEEAAEANDTADEA